LGFRRDTAVCETRAASSLGFRREVLDPYWIPSDSVALPAEVRTAGGDPIGLPEFLHRKARRTRLTVTSNLCHFSRAFGLGESKSKDFLAVGCAGKLRLVNGENI
jgi:hypothetical protein